MVQAVHDHTESFLKQNKFVVTLGGNHSVSIGAIQAHFAHYPNLTVLQFDAHADLRDEYLGSKLIMRVSWHELKKWVTWCKWAFVV